MYAFDYHRPASVRDAQGLLKDGAKLLAGGQTLLPTMKQRLASPSAVVDLGAIGELRKIEQTGGALVIGAMATHAEIAESKTVKSALPGLAAVAGGIGDPHVRNSGTIGGSVANNDPAADYPSAVVGLNATVHTNKRKIAADSFFTGLFETALEEGEIITRIEFPVAKRAGYEKFRNPASRYAMVGVFVAETAGGIRVAVTGAGPCVFRHKEMEAALSKSFSPDALKGIKTDPSKMNSDIHGSGEYRAHLVGVVAKRAAQNALG
jgi:carbon-monoxide dehydrogenase medium subunit